MTERSKLPVNWKPSGVPKAIKTKAGPPYLALWLIVLSSLVLTIGSLYFGCAFAPSFEGGGPSPWAPLFLYAFFVGGGILIVSAVTLVGWFVVDVIRNKKEV